MSVKKYLEIDGVSYPVKLYDVQRSADVLDLYAYRTEDGVVHRKPIGTYMNYTAAVGIEDDLELYDNLFEVLSAPVESWMIKFPNEKEPQLRYVSSVKDAISRIQDDGTLYKGLTFNVVCVGPTRRA